MLEHSREGTLQSDVVRDLQEARVDLAALREKYAALERAARAVVILIDSDIKAIFQTDQDADEYRQKTDALRKALEGMK